MAVPIEEALLAIGLIYLIPGFAVSRAVFPEWRFRGPLGLQRVVETVALSLILSVALVVLTGFALSNAPVGFNAGWSDPLLEAILTVITIVALVIAAYRGAFSREAPPDRENEPASDGTTWNSVRELDRIARRERRLEHALRRSGVSESEAIQLREELIQLRLTADAIKQRRESELAE